MSRATPPRPFDVTALFPQLAPLARTATRLHPRPGSPTARQLRRRAAAVARRRAVAALRRTARQPRGAGGPLPDDIRLLRRNRAAATERLRLDPEAPEWTPEDLETEKRINAGRPWFDGPILLLPVAQLYTRDVPFPCPPAADLLQVLWCPFGHPIDEAIHPRTALFWRSSATVTDVLDAPPEPPIVQLGDYLPEPCLLSPEQVTEFPHRSSTAGTSTDRAGRGPGR